MRSRHLRFDQLLLLTTSLLIIAGVIIFSSAALGLLSRTEINLFRLVGKQLAALFLGLAILVAAANFPYQQWGKLAWPLFLISLISSLLVFVPEIGLTAGGARRWINLLGFTFQPAELLKLSFVVFFASWLAHIKNRAATVKFGFLPYLGILGLLSIILLRQPNTSSVIVIGLAGTVMFLVAGARWRHLFLLLFLGLLTVGYLTVTRPYLRERVHTFFNPTTDLLGNGYQSFQSLIAVGSGGLFGRGFGQSVQKFNYLPEPVGDSIFAVAAEEFGFLGSTILIALFLLFGLAGLKVAAQAPDLFGRYLAVGLTILIVSQSFLHIAAMIRLVPVTGTPLIFISHGGTALLVALLEAGMLLNISRH